jgi:iron complex outermembrane recepter protein
MNAQQQRRSRQRRSAFCPTARAHRRLRASIVAVLGLTQATMVLAQESAPAAELEEVVVTGTLIRGVAPTGSDIVTVSREDIVASGVATTADLLAMVPQVSAFNTTPVGSPDFSSPITVPSLRGIGLGGTATLVLVNGHRMVGAGILQTIPDPSAIPPAAIERVEIVADGASATYGSDAVGGVINMILRRDFAGVEASAQYGIGDGFDTTNVSALFGTAWEGGSAMLAYEYAAHDSLLGKDRDFYTDDLRSVGGADTRSSTCWPGNVSVGGVSYAMPALQPGVNRCDNPDSTDLYPAEHRNSVFASARHNLSEQLELFGEAYYSIRETDPRTPQPGVTFAINSTNPFFRPPPGTNAVAETVQYSFVREFGATLVNPQELDAGGVVAGLNVTLPSEWALELLGNYGWGTTDTTENNINTAELLAAAAGTTTATALDPFGGDTHPAVLERIRAGGTFSSADQELRELSVKLDGPLFDLPGGAVRVAVGAQTHYEEIDAWTRARGPGNGSSAIATSYGDRTVNSAFAEFHVPVVSNANSFAGMRALELSLAARYDDYSDFGDTTTPKFGLNWSPFAGLTLRGSAGKAFHAPSLADSNVSTVDARVQVFPFLPFFPPGAAPGPTLVIAGGQPGLAPEKADTWSLGFDFNPTALDGLNLSATLYNIDFKDVLSIPSPAIGLFTNPALAQYYTYRPTQAQIDEVLALGLRIDGSLTPPLRQALSAGGIILDLRRRNLSRQEAQGVDLNVNYRWNTSAGIFFAGIAGQRELKFDLTAAPNSPAADMMKRGRVKWRARGTFDWVGDAWNIGGYVNYTGEYQNPNNLAQRVDPFVTVDLHVSYSPQLDGWLQGSRLTLIAENALDEEPPLYLFSPGYDKANASPLGRVVSINLRKAW